MASLALLPRRQAAEQMMRMYEMFIEKDATMLEINPMVEDKDKNGTAILLMVKTGHQK